MLKKLFIIFFILISLVTFARGANLDIGFDDEDFPEVELNARTYFTFINTSDYWGSHYYTDYDLLLPVFANWLNKTMYDFISGLISTEQVNSTLLPNRSSDSFSCQNGVCSTDLEINATNYKDSSLVLNLQFNNNQSIDSSQYGNDGTIVGADCTKDVCEFDGVDDYIGFTSMPLAIDSTKDYGISVCFETNTVSGTQVIIGGDRIPEDRNFITLTNNNLRAGYNGVAGVSASSGNIDGANVWISAILINKDTVPSLYINDIKQVGTNNPSTSGTTGFRIGLTANDVFPFNGSIKYVKIRDRVYTAEERAEDYEACQRIIHANTIYVNELNTTGEVWHEDEVHHQGDVHHEDDVKECKGTADDVCEEFNQTDLVYTAEVGSPRVIWDGFGDLIFDNDYLFWDNINKRLGIGNANPQELVHVGAGTDASDISATELLVTRNGPSSFSVRDSTNNVETFVFASTVGGIIGTVTNDPLYIKTDNTNAISIDTSQRVGIGTTSPTADFTVNNAVKIWDNGNFSTNSSGYFSGDLDVAQNITGNQIYGEMWYHNHTGTTLNFAVDSQFYPMFFTEADNLNGFSYVGGFMGSSNLTSNSAGKYKASYRLSGSGQNNHIYMSTILINGVEQDRCGDHKKMAAGGDIVPIGNTCFIDLLEGDDVQVAVLDFGAIGTGDYYSGNLNLVRIGD